MRMSAHPPLATQERAVWRVLEHQIAYGSQWTAIRSVAGKTGCTSESLRRWVWWLRESRLSSQPAHAEPRAKQG